MNINTRVPRRGGVMISKLDLQTYTSEFEPTEEVSVGLLAKSKLFLLKNCFIENCYCIILLLLRDPPQKIVIFV